MSENTRMSLGLLMIILLMCLFMFAVISDGENNMPEYYCDGYIVFWDTPERESIERLALMSESEKEEHMDDCIKTERE